MSRTTGPPKRKRGGEAPSPLDRAPSTDAVFARIMIILEEAGARESHTAEARQKRYKPRSELPAGPSATKGQEGRDVSATLEKAVAQVHAERAFSPKLSWTYYRALMRVEHPAERLFYEIEAA